MKKILGFVILSGFVLMLGVAGSADFANMSFVKVLCLEILGMMIVLSGTSALMHYKRYIRRMMMKKSSGKRSAGQRIGGVSVSVRLPEKELC